MPPPFTSYTPAAGWERRRTIPLVTQGSRSFSIGETSPLHSSYERGCQEKKILPAPRQDADVVTCIQPHPILGGVLGFAPLARRAFQRQCQPQLLVPTQRFHDVV